MSEGSELPKKCLISNGDVTPAKHDDDSNSGIIAQDDMQKDRRSSPRKEDFKDTTSVVLNRIKIGNKLWTSWGGNTKLRKGVNKVKSTMGQSQSGEDEASVPEFPAKRRRLVQSVQESLPRKKNSGGKLGEPEKGGKRTPKKSTSKKSGASKKKVEAKEGEGEYEVEKIVKVKILRNGMREFLIHWKGYSAEYDTWEPEANLDCKDLVDQYFEEHKEAFGASNGEKKRSKSKTQSRKSLSLKRTNSATKGETNANESTKEEGRTRRQSLGKGGKRQRQARNSSVRKSKEEAPATDSEKESKTKKGKGKETLKNLRNSSGGAKSFGVPEGEDQKEYEVERIIDVRDLKEGTREFLIKWRGYPKKYNSWECESDMNCAEKIETFLRTLEQNPTGRELRVERKKTSQFRADFGKRGRKLSSRLGKLPKKSYSDLD